MTESVISQDAIPADVPLLRNRPFQLLWASSASSALGVAVADVGYPLVILGLTGSPADAGLFAAFQAAGAFAAGLPAGHLVDKRSPRAILLAAEGGRALVTALAAIGLVFGWLNLPLLLAVAALVGTGQPMASTARIILTRIVVPPAQLTRALTQDEVRINGAQLAGPPLGGALYGLRVLSHAAPLVFATGSFAASFLGGLLLRAEPDRAAGAEQDAGGRDTGMLAGLTAIWSDPLMRATTMLFATINCLAAGLELIAVVILRDQSVPPALIGAALAGAAVGGLAGAPLVRPLHRLRPGVLMITVSAVFVVVVGLLAVPLGPWWMAGLLFGGMLGVPSLRVLVDVLILRQAPAAERGRVLAGIMTLLGVGIPAGLAGAGLLLQYLPPRTAVLILAGALAAGVTACAANRNLRQSRWPG
jgi:hypothetical protein